MRYLNSILLIVLLIFTIINIVNAQVINPVLIKDYFVANNCNNVLVHENIAYISCRSLGLYAIDVLNFNKLSEVDRFDSIGSVDGLTIDTDKGLLYVADGSGGLIVLDITNIRNSGIRHVATIDLNFSFDSCLGESKTDLYIAAGVDGIIKYDCSDPTACVYKYKYVTTNARSCKYLNDHLYISDNAGYIFAIDTGASIDEIGIKGPTLSSDSYISKDGNYSYTVANQKTVIFKIPTPIEIYSHDNPDVGDRIDVYESISGYKTGYVTYRSEGLIIYDFSDHSNIVELGRYVSNSIRSVYIEGDIAFVTDSELGLLIINVSDPRDPNRSDIPSNNPKKWLYLSIAGVISLTGIAFAFVWIGKRKTKTSNPLSQKRNRESSSTLAAEGMEWITNPNYDSSKGGSLNFLDSQPNRDSISTLVSTATKKSNKTKNKTPLGFNEDDEDYDKQTFKSWDTIGSLDSSLEDQKDYRTESVGTAGTLWSIKKPTSKPRDRGESTYTVSTWTSEKSKKSKKSKKTKN